jgi:hypothetical protein
MGQMLIPALVGAGVGAAGGAAMGKNPLKTALLGAGLGIGGAGLLGAGAGAGAATAAGTAGTGAGAGLIGGANLSTAGGLGLGSGAAGATSSGLGSFLSGIQGVETAPVSLGTGGYASGIGGQAINSAAPVASVVGNGEIGSSLLTNSKGTPLNMMDKVGNYFSNLPTNAMDWAKNNPISAGKMALDVATPAPNAPMQDQSTPIRQGNPDAQFAPNFNVDRSSGLYNVSPNVLPQEDNKVGLLNMLQSRMALTDEEKMKLMQLGQRF